MTFTAPDQTVELEKLNENEDVIDVSLADERLDQPAELEEENENGDVQHLISCARKYLACLHYFGRSCLQACYFNYFVCARLKRGQDALSLPRQHAELEEENESGDVQRGLPPHICIRTYHECVYYFSPCEGACRFHYILCRKGIVAQSSEKTMLLNFVAPDLPEAVEKLDRPVGLEEEDENGNMQRDNAYCYRNYRKCRHRFSRCRRACYHNAYFCLRLHWIVQEAEGEIQLQDALAAPNHPVAFARPDLDKTAEFEEENEKGYVQHTYHPIFCYHIYHHCLRRNYRCKKALFVRSS